MHWSERLSHCVDCILSGDLEEAGDALDAEAPPRAADLSPCLDALVKAAALVGRRGGPARLCRKLADLMESALEGGPAPPSFHEALAQVESGAGRLAKMMEVLENAAATAIPETPAEAASLERILMSLIQSLDSLRGGRGVAPHVARLAVGLALSGPEALRQNGTIALRALAGLLDEGRFDLFFQALDALTDPHESLRHVPDDLRRAVAENAARCPPAHVPAFVVFVRRISNWTSERHDEEVEWATIGLVERTLGPFDLAIAGCLAQLAWRMEYDRKPGEAAACRAMELAIRERSQPDEHDEVQDCLRNLAKHLGAIGRDEEAAAVRRRLLPEER